MCDKTVSKKPFMLKHYPDRYKTQKMCDKIFECLSVDIKICFLLAC